jgi:hypothetical protein
MRLRRKGVRIRLDAGSAARTYDQVVIRAPYRLGAPRPPAGVPASAVDPYVLAWRSLRWRRLLLFAAAAAFVSYACTGGRWLLLPLFVAMGAAVVGLYLFACPRCRGLFFVDNGFRSLPAPDLLLSWYCPHCHLHNGVRSAGLPAKRTGQAS